jgi:hypothetical protein
MNRKTLVLGLGTLVVSLSVFVTAHALDTDLYTGKTMNVPPNVLIIFDTSGSMSDDVPNRVYDNVTNYAAEPRRSGTSLYNEAYVYSYSSGWGGGWTQFSTTVAALDCDEAEHALNNYGRWEGNIHGSPSYGCSTSDSDFRTLQTGRFLNYYNSTLTPRDTKINIARKRHQGPCWRICGRQHQYPRGPHEISTRRTSAPDCCARQGLDATQLSALNTALNGSLQTDIPP